MAIASIFVRQDEPLSKRLPNGSAVRIDGDIARQILTECEYPRQRQLNDDRALLLASAMEQGTFLPNTQLAFCRLGSALYLVNGQHRLTAVVLSEQAQTFRIEIYECSSMADVDAAYCRFDQPGGQRSLTQVSRSLGLHDDGDDPSGLKPSTAALLLRATPLLMIGMKRIPPVQRPRHTRDLDRKKDVALTWKPWAIDYQVCLQSGISNKTARFRTGSVFAVALITLRYQNERAKPFWSHALRDSGLMEGDPRHTLHSHFLSAKKAKTEYDLAEAAAHAWNAWFSKRNITLIKTLGGPIRLAGTYLADNDE